MKRKFVLKLGDYYYKSSKSRGGLLTTTEYLNEARVFCNLQKLRELVNILNCGFIICEIKDGELLVNGSPRKIIIDGKIKTTTFDDQDGDIIEYIR